MEKIAIQGLIALMRPISMMSESVKISEFL